MGNLLMPAGDPSITKTPIGDYCAPMWVHGIPVDAYRRTRETHGRSITDDHRRTRETHGIKMEAHELPQSTIDAHDHAIAFHEIP